MENAALVQHRILFLAEPITAETANRLINGLLLLDAADHSAKIDLYVNSPGGSISDGVAIIDAIHCLQAPVSTICIGHAASMAAWILAAGSPGQRMATPNAEVMLHQAAGGFSGASADMQVYARRMMHWQQRLVSMLSGWTGQPTDRIQRDIERDFFMTAEEAKDYGIIDGVLEPYHPPALRKGA